MSIVLLPKNTIEQKLNRDNLPEYCEQIKNKVENLYKLGVTEFILQDGCPYANNSPHIGHLLNKTLKDFYIKYYLIHSYKVKVSFGWDCHGLPIENKAKSMEGDLIENCKNIAFKYKKIQKDTFGLFGIFSTEPDYITLSDDYIARELELFNKLKESGYIFQKYKPTWYSPTLKTVLANSETEYKDIIDESIYFKLPVLTDHDNTAFLVWTTTEWTVAGNQAVCLSPSIPYCVTNEGFICSEKYAIENSLHYRSFDVTSVKYYANHNGEVCPVLFDDFVTNDKTGIVHLCGGHGDDDYSVLTRNGIEPKNVVEDINQLLEHIATFKVADEFVYKRESVKHSYPVDWRLKEKVYKVLTEQTYLNFDWIKIKQVTKQIKLSSKDRTKLEGMIFSRKDWCLSRQRKWGVQMPGSNDILDVWFDSGTAFSMYDRPADLYIEGVDQHRGWFQSSIIIAAMVDKVPTKRILTHGFVTNELGEKFSKSEENYSPLEQMFNEYGPDVMRLWVLFSDYKNDVVFSEDSMKSAGKQYFRLRNFIRYLVNNLYRTQHEHGAIRSELKEEVRVLKAEIKKYVDDFDLNKAIRLIVNFTNDYSSYLTEDRKNAFYETDINSKLRIEFENEFHYMASELAAILFPFLPFLSVEVSHELTQIDIEEKY